MSRALLFKGELGARGPHQAAGRGQSPFEGARIRIKGWEPGFRKVAFTNFLRNFCGYGLAEAKAKTDRILSGEVIDIELPDLIQVDQATAEIRSLGAVVASVFPSSGQFIYHVLPRDRGWAVKRKAATRATRVFGTKSEAISFARKIARKASTGEFIVHNKDGSIAKQKVSLAGARL